jgi:hypothetical protein
MPAAMPEATCMKKLILIAALAATLIGSAIAQDTTNQDPAAQAKPAQAAAPVTTKSFADYEIGMAFDYPSTWVLVEDPKVKKSKSLIPPGIFGKKTKKKIAAGKQSSNESLFYVPANGRTANLEIYSALWDQTPDLWESNQVDANNSLKRQVVKQWREEILGVPLLLTKIAYDDAAGHEVGLVGLVYSRTPYKMLFRLTSADTDYDAAEFELRQVLQTLHTVEGGLPVPEDPNHPLDKTAYTGAANKAPSVLTFTANKTAEPIKIKKGEVSVPLTVGDKKVILTMPAGWTSEVATDGTVTLHNAAITTPIAVNVATTLDSDPPQTALLKASGQSLDAFNTVTKRDEKTVDLTTAGASSDVIWRWGTGAKGPISSCEACGLTNDVYWLLRYRFDGTTTPAEVKAIDELIDGMSADPAP